MGRSTIFCLKMSNLITLSGAAVSALSLFLFAEALQTPKGTIAGGFIASLLYFFLFCLLGSFQREVRWGTVIISGLIALTAAASVHRVCVTTRLLFSIGWTLWISRANAILTERDHAVSSS